MTMTEPNASTRRLPGAARAKAFAEPSAEQAPAAREIRAAAPPFSPEARSGNPLMASPPAAEVEDVGRDAPSMAAWSSQVVAWKPPAPVEAPAEWGRRRRVLKVLSLGLARPKPG